MSLFRQNSTIAEGNMSFLWDEASQVLNNRQKFISSAGLTLEKCVTVITNKQNRVHEVTADDLGKGMSTSQTALEAEALITTQSGVGLFLLTADCIPLILYSAESQVLALLHMSFKTSDSDLLDETLAYFKKLGVNDFSQLKAYLGPSIKAQSYLYETKPVTLRSDWEPYLRLESNGSIGIDLAGHCENQLKNAGVTQIETSPIDTATDPHYFSHYRSRKNGKPEGRFATLTYV